MLDVDTGADKNADKQDAIESHLDVSRDDLSDIHDTALSLLEFRLSSSPRTLLSISKLGLHEGHTVLVNSTEKLRH